MNSTDVDARGTETRPTSLEATEPKLDLLTSALPTTSPHMPSDYGGPPDERPRTTSGEQEELARLPTQDPGSQTTRLRQQHRSRNYPGVPPAMGCCPTTSRAPNCINAQVTPIPWEPTPGSASSAYAPSPFTNHVRSMFNDVVRPSQKDGAAPPPCENDTPVNQPIPRGGIPVESTRSRANQEVATPTPHKILKNPPPKEPLRDKAISGPT